MERAELAPLFAITGPAEERDLSLAEEELEIPADYKDLLRITDGLSSEAEAGEATASPNT